MAFYETVAFAYESVTVAASVATLTTATFNPGAAAPACRALLTLESGQIRYNYNGATPTATEGHLLDIGQGLVLDGYMALVNFKAIRTGGTSGVLKVTYERGD